MKFKLSLALAFSFWIAVETLTAQIQIAYGPYLQHVKETEATFVWEADKPSIGWIELAPNDGTHFYGEERVKYFDTTNGVKNVSLLHSIKIKGLTPGTTYRYRVYAQEVLSHQGHQVMYGNVTATNVYKEKPLAFTTLDTRKAEMSFAMVNDIHGREGIITQLLTVAKFQEKDLIIFNGDMISQLKDKETIFKGFMNESIELFAKEKPMYYARGNHETRGEFATSFQNYFSPKEPYLYYVFYQGPVAFIVLDTGEDKPDSDIEYSGITDYDNYRSEQMEWLNALKNDPKLKGAKFKIVIAHMPPTQNKTIWHGQKEVMQKFVPMLNELGVDLMLSAHLHQNVYEEPNTLVNFPVLVNSNNSVVTVDATQKEMVVKVLDMAGKLIDQKVYPAQ